MSTLKDSPHRVLREEVISTLTLMNLSDPLTEVTSDLMSLGFPSIGVSIKVEIFNDVEGGCQAVAKVAGTEIICGGSHTTSAVISALLGSVLHIWKTDPTKADVLRPVINTYRSLFDHHVKSNLAEAEYQEMRAISIAESARKKEAEVTSTLTEISGPYTPRTQEERKFTLRATLDQLKGTCKS